VMKGKRFDLNDFRDQLDQMVNMGGLSSLLDKLPGIGQIPQSVKAQVNDRDVKRMIAIVNSMTPRERKRPDLLNGSRKQRVARGSGTQPADVNRLLKQFTQMEKMMKKVSKGGMRGMLRGLGGALGGGGMFPR
jgi:signal recognition particle subunit SRP54